MVRSSAGASLVCLALVVLTAGAIAAAPQQAPLFRGTSEMVRVFVTVSHDDRLVTSLTQDVFEIRDNGKPQPIALFDNTPRPIRIIVMLDLSGSMAGNLVLLRTAAGELFARLGPEDGARVGTFGHEVSISPEFTRDPAQLEEALPRRIAADAPTPLWRAVDEAMDAFGDRGEARPVILVLSDGKDSGPIGFRRRYVSQAEIVDRAREENVMVYGIGMRSRATQPMMPGIGVDNMRAMMMADLPDPGLSLAAKETGGGYREIRLGQDLGAAFAEVVDELHGQYLIGFEPPKRDGKVHDIEVKVDQKGMKTRARKSYVAPKDSN